MQLLEKHLVNKTFELEVPFICKRKKGRQKFLVISKGEKPGGYSKLSKVAVPAPLLNLIYTGGVDMDKKKGSSMSEDIGKSSSIWRHS